jgi:asparagine synthase (glutamine-hydrolysing)
LGNSSQVIGIKNYSTSTPDAIPVIEDLAWHYDERFADSSAVPSYYVSKKARGNVMVSLSGDDDDENFAGYRCYFMDTRENLARNMRHSGIPCWDF